MLSAFENAALEINDFSDYLFISITNKSYLVIS